MLSNNWLKQDKATGNILIWCESLLPRGILRVTWRKSERNQEKKNIALIRFIQAHGAFKKKMSRNWNSFLPYLLPFQGI